jgi:hypothetical protein
MMERTYFVGVYRFSEHEYDTFDGVTDALKEADTMATNGGAALLWVDDTPTALVIDGKRYRVEAVGE